MRGLDKNQRRAHTNAARIWASRGQLATTYDDTTLTDAQIEYARTNYVLRRRMRRTDIPSLDDPAVAWVLQREPLPVETNQLGNHVVRTTARCGALIYTGRQRGRWCPREAGRSTAHYGAGPCGAHEQGHYGKALGAWLMAHAFAQQLDVDPWEALLMAVRIAAGKVSYIESVLGSASHDLELEGRAPEVLGKGVSKILLHPDTGQPLGLTEYRDLSWWVSRGEYWHGQLARCAKMAVDAGVAQWMVQKVEAEASTLAQVLNGVIDGLGDELSEDTSMRMRALLRQELLKLDEAVPEVLAVARGVEDGPV